MNNENFITQSRCQFYITLLEYGQFTSNPNYKFFILKVSGGINHKRGFYKISKSKIITLVESWIRAEDVDWSNNGKHSSTTIPSSFLNDFYDQHQMDYFNNKNKVLDTANGYEFINKGNVKIESTESYLKRKSGN